MTRILHLSDPHFGTERPEVMTALTALIRELAPDALVLTGDITQRARRSQFERAHDFLARHAHLPQLVLAGNHDVPLFNLWARWRNPYGLFRECITPRLESSLQLGDVLLLGVKSTRRRRHVQGEVDTGQVDATCAALSRAPSNFLKVVLTHHPVVVPSRADADNLLRHAALAVPRWVGAGCDLVLSGHIHYPLVRRLDEHYGEACAPAWGIVAGTALSSRTREGFNNSVNLIGYSVLGRERCCEFTRFDFDERARVFEPAVTRRLELRDASARSAQPVISESGEKTIS